MKAVTIFLICIIGCLASSNVWEVIVNPTASSKSTFYVLHDWSVGGGVYSLDTTNSAFPADRVSDVMLKSMGILRSSATWDGVHLRNLFKRPKATALFLIDGLADEINLMSPLSGSKIPVDQSLLTGGVVQDAEAMFSGDNVMNHLYSLFGRKSVTRFISGDEELSSMLSPSMNSLPIDKPSSEEVFRIATANGFNANCKFASSFISELLTIQSSLEKLSDSDVNDRAPDVFVFSFTTLKALQEQYGSDSEEMWTALKMVEGCVKEVTNDLISKYSGNIVIQALVLQWDYSSYSDSDIEDKVVDVLKQYMLPEYQMNTLVKSLPRITVPDDMDSYVRLAMCKDLTEALEMQGIDFHADCNKGRSMLKRNSEYSYLEDNDNVTVHFSTPKFVVETRTDDYPAIFLIIFVTVVPLLLALFAISWAMWNMDPGRDSIIYRNTDNIPGINN